MHECASRSHPPRATPLVRATLPPPAADVILTLRSSKPASERSRGEDERGKICERVRQACAGRSVAEVARLTGFHPETARRYLRGQAPSAEFLAALVRSLHVSADWLLCGEDGAPSIDGGDASACAS